MAVGNADRALLYALSFDLNIVHWFKPLSDIIKQLGLSRGPPFHPSGVSMLPQMACDFLEDRRVHFTCSITTKKPC